MIRWFRIWWINRKFKPGNRIRCPCCGVIFTLVKFQPQYPMGFHATVEVYKEEI
jgi:hypothetical protein